MTRGMFLAVLVLLFSGCGTAGPGRRGYAQALDSGTAACQRYPAYCASVPGEETVIPLGVRAAQVGAAGKTWQVLNEVARSGIEKALVECAKWADAEVNRREFGGRSPTVEECKQQVGGTKEAPVTRAMALGTRKHELARQCAQEKLGRVRPGGFSLEQRYRVNSRTQQLELVSEGDVQALGRKGLEGTVKPDVVIHPGDPLKVEAVFDFKFPCPDSNTPSWRNYPAGHPRGVRNQQDAYMDAFGVPPTLIYPKGAH